MTVGRRHFRCKPDPLLKNHEILTFQPYTALEENQVQCLNSFGSKIDTFAMVFLHSVILIRQPGKNIGDFLVSVTTKQLCIIFRIVEAFAFSDLFHLTQ